MSLLNSRDFLLREGLIYVNLSPFYSPNFILAKLLKASWGSSNILVCQKTNIFDNDLFVYVFGDGTVRFIFKDIPYVFENPFGEEYLIPKKFQLFVQDNIVILFYRHMFVSFVFEKGGFSKIEYKSYQEWSYKCFVKGNVILLSIGRMILSFTLENGRFTMRNYPNRHGIDGGILTFDEGTPPYFVCCINHWNSPLIVVSINLITGQQNTVLEMTKNDYFSSFQMNDDGSLSITTTSRGNYTTDVVDPLKIHDPRESWRQDGGILWDRVRSC